MKITTTGLFLDLLIGLKCVIMIHITGVCGSNIDVTETTTNFLKLSDSDNFEICDILSVEVESEECSIVLSKVDGNDDPTETVTFSDFENIDGERLLIYLKGKSDNVQNFLLKIVMRNWNKLNGTDASLEKLEILADFHTKKEYSEKVQMLSQDVKNGDILKLIFSKLEKSDSQLDRVMLSPSALINSIRNREYSGSGYSRDPDNDVDPEIIVQDFVIGMSKKDEKSLKLMTSLILGLMNETGEHIVENGLKIAENFMTTSLGIIRPISGGVQEELHLYITLLGNAVKEVSKGNWTALGDHVKAQFNHITIGQPGNLSQAVGGQGGPQVQAIAVALDIFIGFVDGIMKSAEIIDKINSFIPLSFGEKFEEGIRAFLRYQPSQDIQILVGTKTGNNELAQFAAKFLEDNENVQTLILPSVHYSQSNCRKDITVKCVLLIFGLFCDKKCDQSFGMHQNSIVMLNNVTDVYLDRARPDSLEKNLEAESAIFCQPGNLEKTSMTESSTTSDQLYCNNAFGVSRIDDAAGGINIISLGDGIDTAIGLQNASNVFLVGAGHKIYSGGNQSDAFVLTGGEFTGDLDGNSNLNTLVIADQFGDENGVSVDLINEKVNLIFASRMKRSTTARLRNFQNIIGRTNRMEQVICACTTRFVNGRGGISNPGGAGTGIDKIEIPRTNCSYDLHVVLDNYTTVENYANAGRFVYDVPLNTEHSIQISEDSLISSATEHVISFDFSLDKIRFIRFDQTKNELVIGELGSNKISGFPIGKFGNSMFHQSPKFVTKSKNGTNTVEAEIRVSSEGSPLIMHHLNSSDRTTAKKRVGFPGVKNIFMLQTGSWNVSGSAGSENVFVMENDTFNGFIEGGGNGSHNVLVLGQLTKQKTVTVNLQAGFVISDKIRIQNVENVVGRENAADVIIATCATQLINGRGGATRDDPDIVKVDVQDGCDQNLNLRIIIHNATRILNSANQGTFYYEIRTKDPLDVRTNYSLEADASHIFIHEFSSKDITNLTFQNGELHIEVMNVTENSKYSYSHKMKPLVNSEIEFYTQPRIVMSDGVELKVASNGEIFGITRANFTQENPTKFGGVNFIRNIFYINLTAEKNVKKEIPNEFLGGELDDLFILSGVVDTNTPVFIDGGNGQDTMVFDSNLTSISSIKLDLNEENPKSKIFQIRNFQIVHGKGGAQNNNEVIVGCNTKYISGFKKIQIHDQNNCNYSLVTEIDGTTTLLNNATKGDFNYKFNLLRSFDADPTGIFLANHSYFLNLQLVEIQEIIYDKIENKLKYKAADKVYEHKLRIFEKDDLFHKQPRILTSDKSELKVSRWGSIYVSQISEKRLGQILDVYPRIAERLNITISVETKDGSAVFIGNSRSANILQNKINMASHLVGQGSQNVYRIVPSKHDVYIYPVDGSRIGENILDMSEVITPIRKERKNTYSPTITQDGEDIIFTLEKFRVILTNGRTWWRNLKVIYDVAILDLKPEFEFDDSSNVLRRQKRNIDTHKWRVHQAPLILNENSEIVILTASDLEPGTEVQIGGQTLSTNFEFIKMDNSLLLTNFGHKESGGGGNLKTLVFTNCFDKSSNFLTDNISVNFTQEHLTYKLEVVGKVMDFKTFSQVQTELRAQAFQEVYPEESKQNIPSGVIIGISVAAAIVLGLILISGLFIWRKRSSGFYVVSWIEGFFQRKQKQYAEK